MCLWPGMEEGKTGPASSVGHSVGETDQTPLQRKLRVGDFLFLYSRGEMGQIVGEFPQPCVDFIVFKH